MGDELRENAFDLCLQQVLQGASIDDVLKRYPQWAVEFRPMLQAAAAGREAGRRIQVPLTAQARSRARLLSETRALSMKPARRFGWGTTRLAPVAFVLLLVVFFTGATTIAAAAQSLPGDSLYSLKLLTEKTRLSMARDPQTRLNLERSFDRQRLEEVDQLISQSRSAPVMFAGVLEQTPVGEWIVGDVRLVVDSQTQISSDVQPGIYVGVQGVLQEDGSVRAERIWGREFDLSGTVQEITGETWVVGGVPLLVPAQIAQSGTAPVGSLVRVRVMQMADGSLVARSLDLAALPADADQSAASPEAAPARATSTEDDRQDEPTSELDDEPEGLSTLEAKSSDDGGETEEPGKTRRPEETPKPTDDDEDEPESSKTSQPGDDDDGETPRPTSTERPEDTPEPEETDKPDDSPEPENTDEPDHSPEPTDD
jgi:hypothetical protein